jgi:hypothetical protein
VFSIRNRQFEKAINACADAILLTASEPSVVAECHIAKLVLAQDGEVRIRAIQMLALLKHNVLVAPLIKELVHVSGTWPTPGANRRTHVLLRLLVEYLAGNPGPTNEENPD